MAHVFSDPIDTLVQEALDTAPGDPSEELVLDDVDVVVIGSGYGGSVAAARLAGLEKKGAELDVMVLERGREYAVGEFPNTLGELPGFVRFRRPGDTHPTGDPDALFELRMGDDLDVLVGSGLGGGSLINANVAVRPDGFDGRWPSAYRGGCLDEAFDEVEDLLGPTRFEEDVPKYRALEGLAGSQGWTAEKATITVTQGEEPSRNRVGLRQSPCTACGNCVTGCNVGAKNTLMMNLIPLARERGARFVTGVNVLTVEPGAEEAGRRWRVRVQRTRAIRTPLEREYFFIEADHVILAAGAMGSTEILQRSRALTDEIRFSDHLGKGFSTNGDALAFSFGQEDAVKAVGSPRIKQRGGPGPTIVGIARAQIEVDGRPSPLTLEDGAIPGALARVYGELLTTAAAAGRIGTQDKPRWLEHRPGRDPLAYHPDSLGHGQVLLMMSDDGARRSLPLAPLPPALHHGSELDRLMHRQVFPSALADWQRKAADAPLSQLDALFDEQSLAPGFDGGQYVPNPLWRLLPRGFVLGNAMPEGRALSVHPLGGCGMGEDPARAVVDPECRVFDPDGTVHEGLYVMDGAVMPAALGTNPFLTIAAVAWRATGRMIARAGWSEGAREDEVDEKIPGLILEHPGDTVPTPPRLILREQMRGHLLGGDRDPTELGELLEEALPGSVLLLEPEAMVLRVTLDPLDLHGTPRNGPIELEGRVALFAAPGGEPLPAHGLHPRPGTSAAAPLAEGTVEVLLLAQDKPKGWAFGRTFRAVVAYAARRRFGGLGRGGEQGKNQGFWRRLGRWLTRLWKGGKGFCRVARMHADYRRFHYEFSFPPPAASTNTDGAQAPALKLVGEKWIRWERGFFGGESKRVWDALLELDVASVTVRSPGGATAELGAELRVDPEYMLDEGLIQIEPSGKSSVEATVSTLGFLGFFGRCLLRSAFWEFGAPEYPKRDREPDLDPPPLRVRPLSTVHPERMELPVQDDELGPLSLELTRYPQASGGEPVLLLHGLAQGSGIFTSRHLRNNMARHMWRAGYDVWLLDYRLSNRFGRDRIPFHGFGMDAIGRHDIPAAVSAVFRESGEQPVKIFAHCVGAVGVEMAILRGALKTAEGVSMVESVCFNAIHPWVMPSPANLARLKLGRFVRNWVSDDMLDPVVRAADKELPMKAVLDRLAFSFARIGERSERTGDQRHPPGHLRHFLRWLLRGFPGPGDEQGTCDRMSLFYGRMWSHENLERSVRRNWREFVGPAPDEIYDKLYYFIERERILDDHGNNRYLTEANLEAHWKGIPTFFLHGEDSAVFNPQSATRSAVRMRDLLGPDAPVRLWRVPGYQHMDPILARGAHATTYREVVAFFEHAKRWHAKAPWPERCDPIEAGRDPHREVRPEPETGPVLRAAWIDGDCIVTRRWAEEFRFNTTGRRPQEARTEGSTFFRVPGCQDWFHWEDRVTDPGPYEPKRTFFLPETFVVGPGSLPEGELRKEAVRQTARGVPAATEEAAKDESRAWRHLERKLRDADPPTAEPRPAWFRRLVDRIDQVEGARDTFNFLVGSCRYPGTPMERDNADSVFAGMLAHIARLDEGPNAEGLDMAFFLGDQIYADADADVFGGGPWRERYDRSYMDAFTSPHMARVLERLPVHFAVDDHELVDGWSGRAHDGHGLRGTAHAAVRAAGPVQGLIDEDQIDYAVRTARSYMSSGREVQPVDPDAKPAPGSFWYALDDQREVNFPCFVLDTRTERTLRTAHRHRPGGDHPAMMGPAQMEAFLEWLDRADSEAPDRPKFVFAGQVIAPPKGNLRRHPALFRNEDGFFGYPATLARIVGHIVDEEIRNVIFVGGDLHLSCAAELRLRREGRSATAWQIVSSGLYAPFPFANRSPREGSWCRDGSRWQRPKLGCGAAGVRMAYRAEWLTAEPAHFLGVSVAPSDSRDGPPWTVDIRAYDADGRPINPGARFDREADDLRVRFR